MWEKEERKELNSEEKTKGQVREHYQKKRGEIELKLSWQFGFE